MNAALQHVGTGSIVTNEGHTTPLTVTYTWLPEEPACITIGFPQQDVNLVIPRAVFAQQIKHTDVLTLDVGHPRVGFVVADLSDVHELVDATYSLASDVDAAIEQILGGAA